jgi:hypothetical protein
MILLVLLLCVSSSVAFHKNLDLQNVNGNLRNPSWGRFGDICPSGGIVCNLKESLACVNG